MFLVYLGEKAFQGDFGEFFSFLPALTYTPLN